MVSLRSIRPVDLCIVRLEMLSRVWERKGARGCEREQNRERESGSKRGRGRNFPARADSKKHEMPAILANLYRTKLKKKIASVEGAAIFGIDSLPVRATLQERNVTLSCDKMSTLQPDWVFKELWLTTFTQKWNLFYMLDPPYWEVAYNLSVIIASRCSDLFLFYFLSVGLSPATVRSLLGILIAQKNELLLFNQKP